jgi:hypothetical protein
MDLAVLKLVNPTEEIEGVNGGEVVPELLALAEDGADVEGKFLTLLPWYKAQHADLSAGRMKDAGQILMVDFPPGGHEASNSPGSI